MNSKDILTLGVIVAVIGVIAFACFRISQAAQTYSNPTVVNTYVDHTFFTATTTNATSTEARNLSDRTMRIDGAKHVTFFFSRGDTKGTGNSGSSRFEVEVSRDGSEWFDYNTLLPNTATSSPSSQSFINVPAGTSTVAAYMVNLGYHFARCINIETTDGEATCRASADY